jgi:hypothetical protein
MNVVKLMSYNIDSLVIDKELSCLKAIDFALMPALNVGFFI